MRQQKISGSLLAEGKGGMTCLLMRGRGKKQQLPGWPLKNEILGQFCSKVRGGFRPG